MRDKIILDEDLKKYFINLLSNNNLSEMDIDEIINGQYYEFMNSDEVSSIIPSILSDEKYVKILENLTYGYSYEELIDKLGIEESILDSFEKEIKSRNITVNEAMSLYRYVSASEIVLLAFNGSSRDEIYIKINDSLRDKLSNYILDSNLINKTIDFIDYLDYTKPLNTNMAKTLDYINANKLNSELFEYLKSSLLELDAFYHLSEIIHDMDILLKNNLSKSLVLYGNVSKEYLGSKINVNDNEDSLIGKTIEENSILKTSVFKNDNIEENSNITLELYVPKKTEGLYISSIINNDKDEVLLNPCNMYITSVNKELAGEVMNITIKAVALSKNLNCYIGVGQQIKLREDLDNYRDNINRIYETVGDNERVEISFDLIDEDSPKKCKCLLKKIDSSNNEQVFIDEVFEDDEDFEKDLLEPCIMDYARRNPVEYVNTVPSQDSNKLKDNIEILSKNNSKMNIRNISPLISMNIIELVPKIKPDIFYKKQIQKSHVQNGNSPLLLLRVKNIVGGFVSVIIISLIVIVVGIIIAILIVYR